MKMIRPDDNIEQAFAGVDAVSQTKRLHGNVERIYHLD